MKKPGFFVVLFMATIVFIYAGLFLFLPIPGWPAQKRVIAEINRNCDVPFALAMPETELQYTDEYKKHLGFGCYDLENDDVSFRLGGYPDILLNKYHITQYEIKSSKYTLMGLQVGCSLDTACKVIEQNGYTVKDNVCRKKGVIITIHSSKNVVTSFIVFVETTSILKVAF